MTRIMEFATTASSLPPSLPMRIALPFFPTSPAIFVGNGNKNLHLLNSSAVAQSGILWDALFPGQLTYLDIVPAYGPAPVPSSCMGVVELLSIKFHHTKKRVNTGGKAIEYHPGVKYIF
jgi:hypothetical protein